ncbi:MAG: DUF116 domain-containing protein [archaeon]
MYDLIGKLIVNGLWIAIALIMISLFFGYVALKRKIILYPLFANILDFFYMPLRTIYIYLDKRKELDSIMVELKNKANEDKYKKSKKRILLAPHCLRSLDCPAPSTRKGIQCKSCGRCPYAEIKKEADKLGMKLYILAGSSAVKHIADTEKFEGALLLACNYELNKVMRYLAPYNIVPYGVPLTKDGCFDTKANLERLYGAMRMGRHE